MAVNIDDPNTYPDDPEELLKLAEEATGRVPEPDEGEGEEEGDESAVADALKGSEPGAAPEQKPVEGEVGKEPEKGTKDEAPKAESKEEPTQLTTIDGIPIITKDGKHVIPHDVLKSARQSRQAAEQRAREAEAKIAELEQRLSAAAAAPKEEPKAEPASVLSEEELTAIKEEWGDGTLATAIGKLAAARAESKGDPGLVERLQKIEDALQAQQAKETQSSEEAAQAAIDENPVLAAWQADEGSKYWEHAMEVNRILSKSEAYMAKPLTERFAELVEKTESLYGLSPHRALVQSLNPKAPSETPKPDVQKAVEQKIQEAQQKTPLPTSLSDFKGGEKEEPASRLQKLEKLSAVEMVELFDGFDTPEQIAAFIAG